MKILLSLFLIILVTSYGCGQKTIYKTKYITKECPTISVPNKPHPNEYQSFKLKFKNQYYYCLTEDDAKILTTNWLMYKSWCENLEQSIRSYNSIK